MFFAYSVITSVLPIEAFYGVITLLLVSFFKSKYKLLNENVFSFAIFLYFLILLTQASETIKLSLVFSVLAFFISLPLINAIYKEHTRDTILKELTTSALIILVVFIANVLCATVFRYAPKSMYGISSGVLYGNMQFTDFNVLGVALFVVLISILKKNNLLLLSIYVVAIACIMLTLRRSVMLVSALGIPFAFLSTLSQQAAKKVILFMGVFCLIGFGVYSHSDFASVFKERYELRNLEDRALEEEKRFIEYELLYQDMFVLKEYSPWFGYQLFNSENNYGKGIFYDRSLHGDLTSIAHSSGLLGVALYLLMIFTAFYKALRASKSKNDLVTLFYATVAFGIYTITGRFTQADCMLLLFLVANLPLARVTEDTNTDETESRPAPIIKYLKPKADEKQKAALETN